MSAKGEDKAMSAKDAAVALSAAADHKETPDGVYGHKGPYQYGWTRTPNEVRLL